MRINFDRWVAVLKKFKHTVMWTGFDTMSRVSFYVTQNTFQKCQELNVSNVTMKKKMKKLGALSVIISI
jgi:hypothetical protein